MQYTLGFLGAGNMAEAIARAAVAQKVVAAEAMIAADPSDERRHVFADLGVATTDDNSEVILTAKQVLLAVKPQMVAAVAKDLAEHAGDGQVILSIMAGIGSAKLNALVAEAGGAKLRIVRIMPNTPMMVGAGMAGVAVGDGAKAGDEALAMKLFSAGASKAVLVEEDAIDAITAVSGSGPAYVFYLAEAMQRAAAALGLGEHADTLVSQTILGAARLMLENDDDPAELRRKVTSPGGTTEAAINLLESRGVGDAILDAIKAAEARSKELGA